HYEPRAPGPRAAVDDEATVAIAARRGAAGLVARAADAAHVGALDLEARVVGVTAEVGEVLARRDVRPARVQRQPGQRHQRGRRGQRDAVVDLAVGPAGHAG